MSTQEDIEKGFLARAAEIITNLSDDTHWVMISGKFMFSDIADGTHRLYRSQRWLDPDYPDNVLIFFQRCYADNNNRAIAMVIHILQGLQEVGLLTDEILLENPFVKMFLQNKGYVDITKIFAGPIEEKYLNIKTLPDDFYWNLYELINKSYSFSIYISVRILARKLLENLIVDILRKKFGMENIVIFYDADHRRFHSFNLLVKNFSDKLDDFKTIIPSLDQKIIDDLNTFREAGNSAAHTLEISVHKGKVDDDKDKLEELIKILVRLYNSI